MFVVVTTTFAIYQDGGDPDYAAGNVYGPFATLDDAESFEARQRERGAWAFIAVVKRA